VGETGNRLAGKVTGLHQRDPCVSAVSHFLRDAARRQFCLFTKSGSCTRVYEAGKTDEYRKSQSDYAPNRPPVPDKARAQENFIFTSEDPAEETWNCEIEIEGQAEETRQKDSCRSDPSKDKRQGQRQEKENTPTILQVQQWAGNPPSAKFCSVESQCKSPRYGGAQQTTASLPNHLSRGFHTA
jgi:hypothetical protein